IRADWTRFRNSLAGAVLYDLMNRNEISIKKKSILFSFRKNGDPIHDTVVEMIEKSSRPGKVGHWINRLWWKSRFIFRQTMQQLSSSGLIRHEKYFLIGIIPMNRYFISDSGSRFTCLLLV
ncbi:MAG: GPP34 family phosphoprotein, partial [Bacteroidales bacterium]